MKWIFLSDMVFVRSWRWLGRMMDKKTYGYLTAHKDNLCQETTFSVFLGNQLRNMILKLKAKKLQLRYHQQNIQTRIVQNQNLLNFDMLFLYLFPRYLPPNLAIKLNLLKAQIIQLQLFLPLLPSGSFLVSHPPQHRHKNQLSDINIFGDELL